MTVIIMPQGGMPTLNNCKAKFSGIETLPIDMRYSSDLKSATYEYRFKDKLYQSSSTTRDTGSTIFVSPGPLLNSLIPSFAKENKYYYESHTNDKDYYTITATYSNWTSSAFNKDTLAYTMRTSSYDSDQKPNKVPQLLGFSKYSIFSIDSSNILTATQGSYGLYTATKGTLPTEVKVNTKSCVYGSCTLINSTVEGAPFHSLNQ